MGRWPRDNQDALIAFYGEPGPEVEAQFVSVVPPFPMTYGNKRISSIKFHKKAAPALRAALQKVWDYYGRDYAVIDGLELEHYDGAYNPRKVRGSETKWSNHAYGAAIDIDAAHNGFGTGHGKMPLPVVAAFKSEGFRWGGDYHSRTDPMHFEACESGEPARSFEQWLDFYKCPRSYNADNHPTVPLPRPKPKVEPTPTPPAADEDQAEPPAPSPKPQKDEPTEPPSFVRRIRNWVVGTTSGVGGLGFLAYLTDWQVVLVLAATVIVLLGLVAGFFLWLFGKNRIRDWISKMVNS